MNKAYRYVDSPLNDKYGLYMFEDVINLDVETELDEYINDLLLKEQEKNNTVKARQVLHFGYTFDYTTLKPNYNNNTRQIPAKIKKVIDDIFKNINLKDWTIPWNYDQVTINKYSSNQKSGIGSHVDTHSVFDDKIVVISLNSPVTMVFDLPHYKDTKNYPNYTEYPHKIDLWIPPRSLMIMSGISRYLYKHRIVTRSIDLDPDGKIVKRGNRTSITIRKINKDGICNCNYPIVCDYQVPSSLVLPTRLNKN